MKPTQIRETFEAILDRCLVKPSYNEECAWLAVQWLIHDVLVMVAFQGKNQDRIVCFFDLFEGAALAPSTLQSHRSAVTDAYKSKHWDRAAVLLYCESLDALTALASQAWDSALSCVQSAIIDLIAKNPDYGPQILGSGHKYLEKMLAETIADMRGFCVVFRDPPQLVELVECCAVMTVFRDARTYIAHQLTEIERLERAAGRWDALSALLECTTPDKEEK